MAVYSLRRAAQTTVSFVLFVALANACVVTEWSDWGPCSGACQWGTRIRTRGVVGAQIQADKCPPLVETQSCISYQPCYAEMVPPFSTRSHKLRICDSLAKETPSRYRFTYGGQEITGYTCYASPCPPHHLMQTNPTPCFNETAYYSLSVADTPSRAGFFQNTRWVNMTYTYRQCDLAEREAECGGSSNATACIIRRNSFTDTEEISNLTLCAATPNDNETWSVCPGSWIAAHACMADERMCVWAPKLVYESVAQLMRFKCPWSGGAYVQSNIPTSEWANANTVECSWEESAQRCGSSWANSHRRLPCRKKYTRYRETGGHEFEYILDDCLHETCNGQEQVNQCDGEYSPFCKKVCNVFGQCSVDPFQSPCIHKFNKPARFCTDAEAARTCTDMDNKNDQCVVLCEDGDMRHGCHIYTRCEGIAWILHEDLIDRPFRFCTNSERSRFSCSPVAEDCLVMCDDIQLTQNCDMRFKCPSNPTVFAPETYRMLQISSTEEESELQCGEAWAADPQRIQCTYNLCTEMHNGTFTQCKCDLDTCHCPYSFPAENPEDNSYTPCSDAFAIVPCPPSSKIAQQVCGVNGQQCVANCTGLYFEPTCTIPSGMDSLDICTCNEPLSTRPLFGLACNGKAIPCDSEEYNLCGRTATGCKQVIEVTTASEAISISLKDPSKNLTATYTWCSCHHLSTNATEVETDSGDVSARCNGDIPTEETDGETRECSPEEAVEVCGEYAIGCIAVKVPDICEGSLDLVPPCFSNGFIPDENASHPDAGFHWEILSGTCACNATTSVSVPRDRADGLNGVVCPGPHGIRECTREEEAHLRVPCDVDGVCRFNCTLDDGCTFLHHECFDALEPPRGVCTTKERVSLCGIDATQCEAAFWWRDDTPENIMEPLVAIPGTQVCDIFIDDIQTCTYEETELLCPGNNALAVPDLVDRLHYRYPYPHQFLCRMNKHTGELIPGTCPLTYLDIRECNRTEAYMYCPQLFPYEDTVPDEIEHVCILMCPIGDFSEEGDRANACRRIGRCTNGTEYAVVSNKNILAGLLRDVARYVHNCTVKVTPHQTKGKFPSIIENPATDCVLTDEYFSYYEAGGDDDEEEYVPPHPNSWHPHSIAAGVASEAGVVVIGPQHHARLKRVRNGAMWAPAVAHDRRHANIHEARAWHAKASNSHKRRGSQYALHELDREYIVYQDKPASRWKQMSGDSNFVTQDVYTGITIIRIPASTNAAHKAFCGDNAGAVLHAGVIIVVEQGKPNVTQFMPGSCQCNYAQNWYPNDALDTCIQSHIRTCTAAESLRLPNACRSACKVHCRRRQVLSGFLFGSEECYQFDYNAACMGSNRKYTSQPLNPTNVRLFCGEKYGTSAVGTCYYDNSFPNPVQTCTRSTVKCQCTPSTIRYPLDNVICGAPFTTREYSTAEECSPFCGIGATSCQARCYNADKTNCYEAHWCICATTAQVTASNCVEWAPGASPPRCNKYSSCGVATLNLTNTAISPTRDTGGHCGELTRSIQYNKCPIGLPIEGNCNTADKVTCDCMPNALEYRGKRCNGFTRLCEPWEVTQCIDQKQGCKRTEQTATTQRHVDTSCSRVCSALDNTACEGYLNPTHNKGDPMSVYDVESLRRIGTWILDPSIAKERVKTIYIRQDDSRLASLQMTTFVNGLLPCSQLMITDKCGKWGTSCTVDGRTGVHQYGSCECNGNAATQAGGFSFRVYAPDFAVGLMGTWTLPDSGKECIDPRVDTFTKPCSHEDSDQYCGHFGVKSCSIHTNTQNIDARSIFMTCTCMSRVTDASTNTGFFTRTTALGTALRTGSFLRAMRQQITCHPEWDNYLFDGILGHANPTYDTMSIAPLVDMISYSSCPINLAFGIACSGHGTCSTSTPITVQATVAIAPYSPPVEGNEDEPERFPGSQLCTKTSQSPHVNNSGYHINARNHFLRGYVQRTAIEQYGVYFVDISRYSPIRDIDAFIAQWCPTDQVSKIFPGDKPGQTSCGSNCRPPSSYICDAACPPSDAVGIPQNTRKRGVWELMRNGPRFSPGFFDFVFEAISTSVQDMLDTNTRPVPSPLGIHTFRPMTTNEKTANVRIDAKLIPQDCVNYFKRYRSHPDLIDSFTNPLDALVIVPSLNRRTWGYTGGASDPFPIRWNGYCALYGVPWMYSMNIFHYTQQGARPTPGNEPMFMPTSMFVPTWPDRTMDMTDLDATNVTVNQLFAVPGGHTFRQIQYQNPLGHPFAVEWRIFTGQQIKAMLRLLYSARVATMCQSASSRIRTVLNGPHTDFFMLQFPTHTFKTNAHTSIDVTQYCIVWETQRGLRQLAAEQGPNSDLGIQANYMTYFKDDVYYFGANPIGPLWVTRDPTGDGLRRDDPPLIIPRCILGPNLAPPVSNMYCRTPSFRTQTTNYLIFTGQTYGGVTDVAPRSVIGGLLNRATGFRCYMLRNKSPLDVHPKTPCTTHSSSASRCTCNFGYSGPQCDTFIAIKSPNQYPIFNRAGRCEHGTWELLPDGNEKCTCHPGWSLVGGVCAWNGCKRPNTPGILLGAADRAKFNQSQAILGRDTPVCSGNGGCLNPTGGCECAVGYSGPFCEVHYSELCISTAKSTNGLICSGRGVCVPAGVGSNPQCICHEGAYGRWSGAFCTTRTLYSESACTGGGRGVVENNGLDIYCKCTSRRYSGSHCHIDKCPRSKHDASTVCSNRPGFGCFEKLDAQNRTTGEFHCAINASDPAAPSPTSINFHRYRGAALESDTLAVCGTTSNTQLCNMAPASGRGRCQLFINTTANTQMYKCVCPATSTDERCTKTSCHDVDSPLGTKDLQCHGRTAMGVASCNSNAPKTPTGNGGCTCFTSVDDPTKSVFTGDFCQYNITDQCSRVEGTGASAKRVVCSENNGRCECSGILNGTHCVGGTFGCVCNNVGTTQNKYGGQFCEGICVGTACASINLCPNSCGATGTCQFIASKGVYGCVCNPAAKYALSNTTGACTRDICASGEDAAGVIYERQNFVLPVQAHANPLNPFECLCDNPSVTYNPGNLKSPCEAPLCDVSPRTGYVCGDPLPSFRDRLATRCHNPIKDRLAQGLITEEIADHMRKICDETGNDRDVYSRRVCTASDRTCVCEGGYKKDDIGHLCVPRCKVENTASDFFVRFSSPRKLLCTCKTGYFGEFCESKYCPTIEGNAVIESNTACVCNSPWRDNATNTTHHCSTPFCNGNTKGLYNATTKECECIGVYRGENCEQHICGPNGVPHATDVHKCTCNIGWAGSECEAPLCPPHEATFDGVNTTAIPSQVICRCLNSEMTFNHTTRICETFVGPPPTETTNNETMDPIPGNNTEVVEEPYEEPPPPPVPEDEVILHPPVDPDAQPSCDLLEYDPDKYDCTCSGGHDNIEDQVCWTVYRWPVPLPPTCDEIEHDEALYNCRCIEEGPPEYRTCELYPIETPQTPAPICPDGIQLIDGTSVCNCTGTQLRGQRCQWRICSNGCVAEWREYDDTGVLSARCFPPPNAPADFPWTRNFTNEFWDCTRSLCGTGGKPITPATGVSQTCQCNTGFVFSAVTTPRCIRPCNAMGFLAHHPETGACICRTGYTGTQCTQRLAQSLSVQPRFFRVTLYEANVFGEPNSYNSVTRARFKEAAIEDATKYFSIPVDLITPDIQRYKPVEEALQNKLLYIAPIPPPRRRGKTFIRYIFSNAGAVVAAMSVLLDAVVVLALSISYCKSSTAARLQSGYTSI